MAFSVEAGEAEVDIGDSRNEKRLRLMREFKGAWFRRSDQACLMFGIFVQCDVIVGRWWAE